MGKTKYYIFTATMFLRANATTFINPTTIRARMNTTVFRDPIPLAHTLMSNAFATI